MKSPHFLAIVGMVIWATVALTAAPHALSHHHVKAADPAIGGLAEDSLAAAAGCSDLQFHFERHGDAVVQSEARTITKADAPTLHVDAEPNGRVQVQGWDQEAYSVTLCKAAEAGGDAESVLSNIHLAFHNGELGVSAPGSGSHWAAHLLIRAPKAASMDLKIHNGPLSISAVEGSLKVRAENGPVTVSDTSGDLDLTATNGPVTVEGSSGKQSIHTENGPVTVSLQGESWAGAGLEAHATNGPISLRIPSGYKSGVLLESEGSGPFQCRASVCSEGRKTWDEEQKRIEFGSGPTLVRVSTINGPVSVQ